MAPTQLGLRSTVTPQLCLCRVGWPHLPSGQEACSSVQGTAHFTPLYNVRHWTMTLLPPALSQLGIICMMDSPRPCRPMSMLRGLLICTVNSLIFLCCLHCVPTEPWNSLQDCHYLAYVSADGQPSLLLAHVSVSERPAHPLGEQLTSWHLHHETHCKIATIWPMSLLMGNPHSCWPMSQ